MTDPNSSGSPARVDDVDWEHWIPAERAVLCFILEGNRLLLIHKKTGLGVGKINAPGGRIEPGESRTNAAIRETEEEVGLRPGNLVKRAELFFIFTDGYSLHGTVYFADVYSGPGPIETPEAKPFWCRIDEIPYDRMWADDRHWLPLVLEGKFLSGYFIFDGDLMLDSKVVLREFWPDSEC